jgi:hypothetical protein
VSSGTIYLTRNRLYSRSLVYTVRPYYSAGTASWEKHEEKVIYLIHYNVGSKLPILLGELPMAWNGKARGRDDKKPDVDAIQRSPPHFGQRFGSPVLHVPSWDTAYLKWYSTHKTFTIRIIDTCTSG